VSGGESKDVGGDGYGGNTDKLPLCGGGAAMSMCNGIIGMWNLERIGDVNASGRRALDTARSSSAVGRSYAGTSGIFTAI
jgi:hypothetical protein